MNVDLTSISKTPVRNRILVIAAVILGSFLAIIATTWLFWAINIYGLKVIADGFAQELATYIPLNTGFLNVLTYAILLIFIFFSFNIFSMSRHRRRRGMISILLFLLAYNTIIGVAALNFKIDPFSGASKKCYFFSGGSIIYQDLVPGNERKFDPVTGEPCIPVTQEMARKLTRWEKGERPQEIDGNSDVEFFDPVLGTPKTWYAESPNGDLELFDADGFHPVTARPLMPVTPDISMKWLEQIDRKKRSEIEAKNRRIAEELERKKREEEQQRIERERTQAEALRKDMQQAFNVDSYSNSVIVVGMSKKQNDTFSEYAREQLLHSVLEYMQDRDIRADVFRPDVYKKGYYEQLLHGKIRLLSDVGLMERLRGGIMMRVEANCRSSVAEMQSCTISVEHHSLSQGRFSAPKQVSEVGIGAIYSQAIENAVKNIIFRHPVLFQPM